jgi:hypothetical protein
MTLGDTQRDICRSAAKRLQEIDDQLPAAKKLSSNSKAAAANLRRLEKERKLILVIVDGCNRAFGDGQDF